jgi:D-alanyl-D-alanine carboxypeptidase/D-alanyl-D-alanine-endopeptidase (penicillin-binding protein 4)
MFVTKRWGVPLVLLALAAAACSSAYANEPSSGGARTVDPPSGTPTGPTDLVAALQAITDEPEYAQSDWGYVVLDEGTGEVLVSRGADKLFDPGSTMKTFAVSAALRLYPSDYTFRTPVYRVGAVDGGALDGNLVLVASGDLSFGLRRQPDGSLYYENLPEFDHSYATLGLPGAVEPPGDPLSALDELAAGVKAAGITRVDGDVVIDDRLFTPIDWPDGLVSPMWVNENLIDIKVMPGASAGQATTIDWRPQTASYTVENQATTIDATGTTSLDVSEPTPGHLVVTGQIAAGPTPTLVVREITDPSAFARTAFIEALERAGVTVAATPTGPNPATLLPAAGSYDPGAKLGEHVSATLAEYVKLIMKVSYNRGADLMTCLAAVRTGSTDCEQGLVAEVETFTGLGVSRTGAYPFDGAGSNDQSRATPAALASFYRAATTTPYAGALLDSLPILGVDGTLANVLVDSPVAGHAQIKTGNRAVGTAADQLILLGNSLAGYVQAASGRRLTTMIAVGNVPLDSVAAFEAVTADQARMVELIHQAL